MAHICRAERVISTPMGMSYIYIYTCISIYRVYICLVWYMSVWVCPLLVPLDMLFYFRIHWTSLCGCMILRVDALFPRWGRFLNGNQRPTVVTLWSVSRQRDLPIPLVTDLVTGRYEGTCPSWVLFLGAESFPDLGQNAWLPRLLRFAWFWRSGRSGEGFGMCQNWLNSLPGKWVRDG